MKTNKAELSVLLIITVIVLLITLLVVSFQAKAFIQEGAYRSSIAGCSAFFSSIDGESVYFGTSYDKPTTKLIASMAALCPSREIDNVKETSLSRAAELVNNCWSKTAKGEDIFANNVRGEGICLYCGSIEFGEDIDNFKTQFSQVLEEEYPSLFEETPMINLNEAFLHDVTPKTLHKGDKLTVFYYAYKPQYPQDKDIGFGTWVQEEGLLPLSKILGVSSQSLLSSDNSFVRLLGRGVNIANAAVPLHAVNTQGGILLTQRYQREESTFNSIEQLSQACTVVVPEKHYTY